MVAHIVLMLLAVPALEPFTVEDAVSLATEHHPALRAAAFAVEEEQGEALQAGMPPNPEIDTGVEGWRRHSSKDTGYEFLVGFSQTLPIAGTRRFARKAGMIGADAAALDVQALRLEIAGYARALFYETLAAQKRLVILDEMTADASALAALTRIRFEEGDLPEIDLMRVVAEQYRYEADREGAREMLEGLRARLAKLCGVEVAVLPECAGDMASTAALLPDITTIEARLLSAPAHAARGLRAEQAKTTVEAVRRSAAPEPALRVGLRRDTGEQLNSIDLGISLALPLFDRKQGAVAAARAREQRLRAENEATIRDDLRSCMALRSEAQAAMLEAEQLRDRVIPQLEAVDAIMAKALEIGGATLFETLAAKRDIAETRLALLESERAARTALAALERLLGAWPATLSPPP